MFAYRLDLETTTRRSSSQAVLSLQDDFKKFLKTAEKQTMDEFTKTVKKLYRMKLDKGRMEAIKKEETETKNTITEVCMYTCMYVCMHVSMATDMNTPIQIGIQRNICRFFFN